jgi:hypothetical protein
MPTPLNKPSADMLRAGGNALPQALATTALAGTAVAYSREDHVHPLPPMLGQAWSSTSSYKIGDIATADGVAYISLQASNLNNSPSSSPAFWSSVSGSLTTSQLSGYIATSQLGALSGVAQLDSSGTLRTTQIPALTTAQIAQVTPAAIGAIAASAKGSANGVAALDASSRLTTTQAYALTGDVQSLAGDPATTVVKLQGKSVSSAAPSNGQVLQWNGAAWIPGALATGGSGGGGITFYFNANTAAQSPTTYLPTTPVTPKELGRSAEVAQTTVTSTTISQAQYDLIAGFVTDVLDPDTTSIPAGLWDFNLWASSTANSASQTVVQLWVYKYSDTAAPVLLATSDDVGIYDPTITAQYILSVTLPQTTILVTDRIYVELRAKATANNKTITFKFGGNTPSHLHTTLSSVGGSGVVKVVNGIFQTPASLITNEDVSDTAAIAQSKINGLTTALSGKVGTGDTIAIAKGGTGQTTKDAAFNALSPITAAGDLIVGTGANTAGRVAIGTNGHVLTSNGVTVSWQAPAAGGGVTSIANGGTGQTTNEGARNALGSIQNATVRHGSALVLQTIGTLTGAVYSSGSAVVTFTSSSVTLVPGMSLSILTSAVIKTVDSATQVTMTAVSGASGSGAANVFNSTISTLVSSSIITMDNRTMAVGDIVILTAQTANAQNGPWIINSLAGSVMSFVRPSYWSGTIYGNALFYIQQGVANYGQTVTVSGALSTGSTVGLDSFSAYTAVQRASNASLVSNTFTGKQTFQAGATSSGAAPFAFQAGVLMTTPQAHAVEWDGLNEYFTSLVSLSGTWTTSAATVTVTTGTTAALTIGAVVVSGISPTTLTVASIQSDTQFTLSGTPTNTGTASAFTLASRRTLATLDTNIFTGTTIFAPGASTGKVPAKFQAGALTATTQAHALEWDSANMYLTPVSAIVTGGTGGVSSTSLVVASVTSGFISVGSAISGTGVTAGTTIVAGPPAGGTGTYTLSSANTISTGTTITCVTRRRVSYAEDSWTINSAAGIASASTINFDTDIQDCMFYTVASLGNWTLNIRASTTKSLNNVLSIGQSRTIVFMATNGTTGYKLSGINIDGVAQTIKWLGGAAPTAGSTSAIDSYSITVVKTGSALFTVLASFVKFA